MSQRSLPNRLWYQFLRWLIYLAGMLAYGVRYSGRENIPKTGAVLVVSNHQSHFDPPLVGAGCWRRMNYLARETLFRFAPLGWLIHSLDAIPIDRDGLGLNGIKESLRRLKRGEMVLIFPEGTRTRDGEMAPFRPGFTVLAARSKAWILPVAIEGAFDAWPRSRKLPRPRHDPCPLRRAHPAGRSCRLRRARTGGRSRAAGPPLPCDVAKTPGVRREGEVTF